MLLRLNYKNNCRGAGVVATFSFHLLECNEIDFNIIITIDLQARLHQITCCTAPFRDGNSNRRWYRSMVWHVYIADVWCRTRSFFLFLHFFFSLHCMLKDSSTVELNQRKPKKQVSKQPPPKHTHTLELSQHSFQSEGCQFVPNHPTHLHARINNSPSVVSNFFGGTYI